LRAFGSQLLCEQVVGRGLRRMDYTPDPTTGLLTAEYVDIFGVPFSLIPFKGREPKNGPPPEDKPKHAVMALPERRHLEIRYPVVEGYVVELRQNLVKCDVNQMETMRLDPIGTPTAAFIRPQVGYQVGHPSTHGGFGFELVDRQAYYNSVHPQTIAFEIAKEIVRTLTETALPGKGRPKSQSRGVLFPQVLRITQEYIANRVDLSACHPCEIGLQTYAQRIVSLLATEIMPDDERGEAPLLPRLNRYQPIGSTEKAHFKTVKPVQATHASHLNYVACDTDSWEQAAVFQLEKLAMKGLVLCYARNDHLEFNIPYELYGNQHVYEPDFLVKLKNNVTIVLEIKGQEPSGTEAKHQAARRWVTAVNNWGKLGKWEFLVCRDPQRLSEEIEDLI
jgi:type III restriction enzyme